MASTQPGSSPSIDDILLWLAEAPLTTDDLLDLKDAIMDRLNETKADTVFSKQEDELSCKEGYCDWLADEYLELQRSFVPRLEQRDGEKCALSGVASAAVRGDRSLQVEPYHFIPAEQEKTVLEYFIHPDDSRNGVLLARPFHDLLQAGEIRVELTGERYVVRSLSDRTRFLEGRQLHINRQNPGMCPTEGILNAGYTIALQGQCDTNTHSMCPQCWQPYSKLAIKNHMGRWSCKANQRADVNGIVIQRAKALIERAPPRQGDGDAVFGALPRQLRQSSSAPYGMPPISLPPRIQVNRGVI